MDKDYLNIPAALKGFALPRFSSVIISNPFLQFC